MLNNIFWLTFRENRIQKYFEFQKLFKFDAVLLWSSHFQSMLAFLMTFPKNMKHHTHCFYSSNFLKPFLGNVRILEPLQDNRKPFFSGVFRRSKIGALAQNRLSWFILKQSFMLVVLPDHEVRRIRTSLLLQGIEDRKYYHIVLHWG